MSHEASFVPLFVPPVGRQYTALVQPLELRTGSCSTPGCPFDGHPLHGGKCSACGQGWSPARLEQLRSLAEAADADTRARAFVDWDEPGVTLAPGRYEKLRRAVERWASNNTSSSVAPSVALEFVAKLLLESRRLLTPEQARGIWRAVSPMVRDVDYMDRSKFVVFLASFLSSPERWCGLPSKVRQEFWPDENDGCTWGWCAPHKPRPRLLPYDQVLRKRLKPLLESKLMAAACLRRTTLPKSVLRRIRIARLHAPPGLPPLLVKRILLWCAPGWFAPTQVRPEASRWNQNSWMFAPNQVRPEACRWMVCNQFRSSGDDESGEWFKFLDHMRRRS